MRSKLARVLRMSPAELKVRLRERRDSVLERMSTARGLGWRGPRLSNELDTISHLLTGGKRSKAGEQLARYVRTPPHRFLVDRSRRDDLVRQIHATFSPRCG